MAWEKVLEVWKEAFVIFVFGMIAGAGILSYAPLLQSDKPATKEQIKEAINVSPCVKDELNAWARGRDFIRESVVKATIKRCEIITAQQEALKTE